MHLTQNIMSSTLKPNPKTKICNGKITNNEPSEHKPSHRTSTCYYLTACESTFNFLLAMSLITDPFTTVFQFFIAQLRFLQLLFPQLLFLLLPFSMSTAN